MVKTIFERTEKKYVITVSQKNELLSLISDKIKSDEYGKSNVNSIYYDTDDYRLIRNSIDKPVYKEKLRLRSYSVPKGDSIVFLELKKKYKGVVYKRRKTLKYDDAQKYLKSHILPDNSQIMREIDWTMNFYKTLMPKMFIGYDRLAYVGSADENLRITFDFNLRFRTDNLSLDCGNYGENIIGNNYFIMEIKALNAMPLWLCFALDKLKIYPSSFSKYGTAYQIVTKRNSEQNGGISCA
ncbi:MAG: polyphosphate polymerase domain-containing protein [Ruminococcus sp.]